MANPWDIDWSTQPAAQAAPGPAPWEVDWSNGAPAPTWGATAIDSAKGIGKGLAQGAAAIPGLPGDINSAITSVSGKIANALGADPAQTAAYNAKVNASPLNVLPTTQGISDFTGVNSLPDATTPIGKAAQNVAQFVPGALAPGGEGSALAKIVKFGLAPGLASEGAGQLADAAGASPAVQGGVRLAASLAAPGIADRVVSPFQNPDVAHAANIAALRVKGVQPTAGQAVDSETLRTIESVLSPKTNLQQGKQVTQAAFNRVGMNVPNGMQPGSGGTIDQLMTNAGAAYDGIAARNTFSLDPQGAQDLTAIRNHYAAPGPYTPDTEHAINGTLARVANLLPAGAGGAGAGQISGPNYIALRSNIRAAARSADPQRAEGLNDIVNSLDAAFERGLPPGSPDAGALPTANQNYRNALVLQHAASAAGALPGKGIITPENLASATKSIYGRGQYVRGQDDFSDLANPAVASLARIPDSGTSKRAAVIAGMAALGGGAGYVLGSKFNTDTGNDSPISGLLTGETLGPMAAALLGRRLVMNPVTQRLLANQVMTHTPGLLSLPGAYAAANAANGPDNRPHITVHPGLLSPGQ
jgi:hypothetical protein